MITHNNTLNAFKACYRGRFAPSPTGDLHFGSLVTAMASYADARFNQGKWIVRIDDIDKPRVQKGSTQSILYTLEALGFIWDERIYYQSENKHDYLQIIDILTKKNMLYPCYCTRKEILAIAPSGNYPGTCKSKNTNMENAHRKNNYALRVDTNTQKISFRDAIQGEFNFKLCELSGDFIVYRSDQITSYLLAFVADVYIDKVSHIIRGFDLLESTPKQLFLQQLLSYPIPQYAHIPIISNSKGIKLSKSSHAKAVDININTLINAAKTLGQTLDNRTDNATINEFWQELILHWDINKVPKVKSILFPD